MTTRTHLNKAAKTGRRATIPPSVARELAVIVREIPYGWVHSEHSQASGLWRAECYYCYKYSATETADQRAARRLPIEHAADCIGVLATKLIERVEGLSSIAYQEACTPTTPTGRAIHNAIIADAAAPPEHLIERAGAAAAAQPEPEPVQQPVEQRPKLCQGSGTVITAGSDGALKCSFCLASWGVASPGTRWLPKKHRQGERSHERNPGFRYLAIEPVWDEASPQIVPLKLSTDAKQQDGQYVD